MYVFRGFVHYLVSYVFSSSVMSFFCLFIYLCMSSFIYVLVSSYVFIDVCVSVLRYVCL